MKEAEPLCWLMDTHTGEDSEQDYCPTCAKREANYEGDHIKVICPPSGTHEVDSFPACHICDAMLDAEWTDNLVSSELAHFEEYGIESACSWRSVLECINTLGGRETGDVYDGLCAVIEKALAEEKSSDE